MIKTYVLFALALLAAAPAVAGGKAASAIVEEEESSVPPAPTGDERRAIGDAVRGHTTEVHTCYAQRLSATPGLAGTLTAKFDIGPSGKVVGATADGIGDAQLVACVVKAVRSWEFAKPASGGKLRIAYPFLLSPDTAQASR